MTVCPEHKFERLSDRSVFCPRCGEVRVVDLRVLPWAEAPRQPWINTVPRPNSITWWSVSERVL